MRSAVDTIKNVVSAARYRMRLIPQDETAVSTALSKKYYSKKHSATKLAQSIYSKSQKTHNYEKVIKSYKKL